MIRWFNFGSLSLSFNVTLLFTIGLFIAIYWSKRESILLILSTQASTLSRRESFSPLPHTTFSRRIPLLASLLLQLPTTKLLGPYTTRLLVPHTTRLPVPRTTRLWVPHTTNKQLLYRPNLARWWLKCVRKMGGIYRTSNYPPTWKCLHRE